MKREFRNSSRNSLTINYYWWPIWIRAKQLNDKLVVHDVESKPGIGIVASGNNHRFTAIIVSLYKNTNTYIPDFGISG